MLGMEANTGTGAPRTPDVTCRWEKAKNGSWLIVATGPDARDVRAGDLVEVSSRMGRVARKYIGEVLRQTTRKRKPAALCTVAERDPAPQPGWTKFHGKWCVRAYAGDLADSTIEVVKASGEKAEVKVAAMIGTDTFRETKCWIYKPAPKRRKAARRNGDGERLYERVGNNGWRVHRPTRLVGTHTSVHCECGNWAGAGSPCLYSYGEAKEEGEARNIHWERVAA